MVLRNKESGWMFFKMTEQQQLDFLNDVHDVDINFRYIGIDKRVVSKIAKRLKNGDVVKIENNYGPINM